MLKGRLSGKQLTEELRRLADEAIDMTPDGQPITRREKLADLVWRYAIGWSEKVRDPETGTMREIYHPPVAWAAQFMWERLEGKAVIAQPESEGGIKAVDKVRDLAKQRLNGLVKSGPPTHKAKQ